MRFLWLVFISVLVSANSHRTSKHHSLSGDTDVNYLNPKPDEDFEVEFVYQKPKKTKLSSGVKRRWGAVDVKATVGSAFSYTIAKDAFEGDFKSYEFEKVPSWLTQHSARESRHNFEGVASESDIGTQYITVRVTGTDGSVAKDEFSIDVFQPSGSELRRENGCGRTDDLTGASLVLYLSWSDTKPTNKFRIVNKLAKNLKIDKKKIRLIRYPMEDILDADLSVLSGKGDISSFAGKPQISDNDLTVARWIVGCQGEVESVNQESLILLQKMVNVDKLTRILGVHSVGWSVAAVSASTGRPKRQAADYSGDYDDTLNSDDDEYRDYEDHFNLIDRVKALPAPTMTSELPTNTQTRGLGSIASPMFRPVPISTPIYVPVKPTRVVSASPTVDPSDAYMTTEAPHLESHGLESSLLVHPTTSADYTTPLSSVPHTSSVSSPPTISPTSTMFPTGETTEYDTKNFPPRVNQRIQKLAWVAGSVYRLSIPEDTFVDVEDGSTRNLKLVLLDEDGEQFKKDSWVQFDEDKQEVYALPLEKHVGPFRLILKAFDQEEMSAQDILDVTVRQHTQARLFHHEFEAVFELQKMFNKFANNLDWQVKIIEKIASFLDDSVSSVNIRNVTVSPPSITWTNVSLIRSQDGSCPIEELQTIAQALMANPDNRRGEPSRDAARFFAPEFQLREMRVRFFGSCESHVHHHGRHEMAGEREEVGNQPPVMTNPVDELRMEAGRMFRYQVPEPTCYDMESGSSRNLHLRLLTKNMLDQSKFAWLQFDVANQEFFGLPLQKNIGREEYFLECRDEDGESIRDALIVEVYASPLMDVAPPVVFSLTVDTDYDTFISDAHAKARFLEHIGNAFGDAGSEYVFIRDLKRGSVMVEWQNASLPTEPCPEEQIQRLRNVMIDDKSELKKDFRNRFLPEFVVSGSDVLIPAGSCLAGDTPTHLEEPTDLDESEDEATVGESGESTGDDDYLVTFVVPAAIIAAMLVAAGLIACCIWKRRRYGKMSMTNDSRTFVSKGIPIIFAEELDEPPTKTADAKSPIIMKEEKPPMPPPHYQQHSSRAGTLQASAAPPAAIPSEATPLTSDGDAPYSPPPPFSPPSNGGTRNHRPNLPPAYRKPPTYVAP